MRRHESLSVTSGANARLLDVQAVAELLAARVTFIDFLTPVGCRHLSDWALSSAGPDWRSKTGLPTAVPRHATRGGLDDDTGLFSSG
jgi:hypothetical protein